MREGRQHEHTKRTREGQAVRTPPKGQQDNMRGERQEERTRERQDNYGRSTTGDRLAATANEHLKKDNKHEEDRREKIATRGEGHPDRACRRGLTLWPRCGTAGGQEEDKRRKMRKRQDLRGEQEHEVWRLAGSRCQAGVNKRTRTGQKEDKERTTRRQHHCGQPAEGEQEDKRRTTGRQEEDKRKKRKKKGKKRTTGGQRPDTAFTGVARDCDQLLFSEERTQQ